MVVVDTPVTPEENKGFLALPAYQQRPDGWLYAEYVDPEDSLRRVRLTRLAHRWYVCHRCRRFIRGMKRLEVHVGTLRL
jgi:hypothetical protein